jgi:threonine dehydrogenase-like Zn-dependent dehydrogenase
MKALIFRETGEPNGVLKMAEISTPPLAPGEAFVRVLLSPINPSDLHMVRGRYGYQPQLPASPGAGRRGDCGGCRSVRFVVINPFRREVFLSRSPLAKGGLRRSSWQA